MLFTKSKWLPLSLAALILLLAACGNSTQTQPVQTNPDGHTLVVIVPGLGSQISNQEVQGNGGYGDEQDFVPLENSLKLKPEFKNAQFMFFSYLVNGPDGQLFPYGCSLTFFNKVHLDELRLASQIDAYVSNHPNTNVYIISHSLGGVITFAYVSDLVENNNSLALPNGGKLAGIAIMDSPLGGTISTQGYKNSILARSGLCGILVGQWSTIDNLFNVYKTATDTSNLGMTASIFQSIINDGKGTFVSNQKVGQDAVAQGLRMLVVGNVNDLLWQPDQCNIGTNFLSTEFMQDVDKQANGGVLYARSINSGDLQCSAVLGNVANHLDVYKNGDVWIAIYEVFTGTTLDKLDAVPTPSPVVLVTPTVPVPVGTPSPNPTNTPVPTLTPTNTPMPTPTQTTTPTPIPSNTPIPTPTDTPTLVPTNTPVPTPSPTDTPTATPTSPSTPTPTPMPVTLPGGTWNDPYGGASYGTGEPVTIVLTVNGSTVTGTMTGDASGASTQITGTTGPLSSFNSQDQGFLNNVIQHWGSGTGVFLVYQNTTDFLGAYAGSIYYAVLQSDGKLQGFWYFPNQSVDTGALNFNRVS